MNRNWLAIGLAASLLINALLLTLWLVERDQEPAVAAAPVTTSSPEPDPTAVPSRTPVPEAVVSVEQLPTETPPPAESPQPTETPLPTATPPPESTASAPTETPLPEPTVALTPTPEIAGPEWLRYVNLFRTEGSLAPLLDDRDLSLGSLLHSQYMVYTGDLRHDQNPSSEHYTPAGQTAAQNSNIAIGSSSVPSFEWAFNYWISAPFHAVPVLDPELTTTGFGLHRDEAGTFESAATLDVRSGLGQPAADATYPLMFPRDGGRTWVLRYSLPEFPPALSSCSGYSQPSGPPIILQMGDGTGTHQVGGTAFVRDGQQLPHCWFDESTYYHPDQYWQGVGRTILDLRDAIVLIPQQPLEAGATYNVRIDVDGAPYNWSFRAVASPREGG